ncbi:MAG: cytochrome c biogenesis protein ResB [Acidobacteria bacterium]|nr:cytochrome c biogenesis protein ResB [Acidobacteriota bacterium]
MAESKVQIAAETGQAVAPRPSINFVDRALSFLSSVKLGITLMIVLILFSILGTIIIQYNIEGFDKYYTSLTPAQRQLYLTLGLFDLYHTWWFNTLLILFSLNLVLVSIDLFPKAWRYVTEPTVRANPAFLRSQPVHRQFRLASDEGIIDRLTEIMRSFRCRVKVTSDESYITVFGQKGLWNRFLVFIVHIGVLVILGAAFVGSRWGYEGIIPLAPGETASAMRISGAPVLNIPDRSQPLPFQVVCNNVRVDLRDPDGPLAQGNFKNWYTDVTLVKGDQRQTATVYLNHPLDYEGYRFFQASFGPPGEASDVTIDIGLPNKSHQSLKLERNKPVNVDGLGQVMFIGFLSDFGFVEGRPQSVGQDYKRPAAQLAITKPNGERLETYAFSPEITQFIQSQTGMSDRLQVNGYSFMLKEFTRVPAFHVLQAQYDPGVDYTYFGYFLLCASLIAVFMFSHERVWAVIDRKNGDVATLYLGGHTNRNQSGLEKKFASLVERVAALGAEEAPEKTNGSETKPSNGLT